MNLRKITKKEVKSVAKVMAECFSEYPLYNAFFDDTPKKGKQIFYFFWFRLYMRRDYTYTTDGGEFLISIMRPNDRDRSPLGLVLNPSFFFGFLFHNNLSVFRKIHDFGAMEEGYRKKYYDPKKDTYVKAVCVKKEYRSTNLFFDLMAELDDGSAIYAETHSAINARLYRMIGAKICEKGEWHGIEHYIVKRPALAEEPSPETVHS